MKRIILWGTGKVAKNTLEHCEKLKLYEICGVIDSNPQKWGFNFYGLPILSPDDPKIIELNCDLIVILADAFDEISELIRNQIPAYRDKIENKYFFYKERIFDKYKNTAELEIRNVLEYLNDNPLDVFNYGYVKKYADIEMNIQFDASCGLFYTYYMQKKMYFSKKFDTEHKVREYYKSLLVEQDEKSPHKYCSVNFKPQEGDVIVDAGAAEGNFALEYIDSASKIFLIEPDSDWIEALRHTFKDYSDKVYIIQSFLGAFDEMGVCQKLDSLIECEVNFIKMDIEGAEWEALRGARNTIERSKNLKMAICSYHSDYDQTLIEDFMDKEGISHDITPGYMWFPYSYRQTYVSTELHRGVVRGFKGK